MVQHERGFSDIEIRLYPSFSKTKMAEHQAYSGIEVHLGCTEFTGNLNTHSWVVRVCG